MPLICTWTRTPTTLYGKALRAVLFVTMPAASSPFIWITFLLTHMYAYIYYDGQESRQDWCPDGSGSYQSEHFILPGSTS